MTDNFDFKDATGATKTLKSKEITTGVHAPQPIPSDDTGVALTGQSMARIKSAASTNLTSVKASAARLYGVFVRNRAASEKFLKFYDKASAPTLASDVPKFTVPVPAGGEVSLEFVHGLAFTLGLATAITGGVADTDTTATVADDVHGVLAYK